MGSDSQDVQPASHPLSPDLAALASERDALAAENQKLNTLVKALIAAEAKLHSIQNSLDHQLNVFGKLHELGVRITRSLAPKEIVPPALLARANQRIVALREPGPPLGRARDTRYQSCVVQVDEPIRLLLFSDGLIEAGDARSRTFGLRRLDKVFSAADPAPARCLEQI